MEEKIEKRKKLKEEEKERQRIAAEKEAARFVGDFEGKYMDSQKYLKISLFEC